MVGGLVAVKKPYKRWEGALGVGETQRPASQTEGRPESQRRLKASAIQQMLRERGQDAGEGGSPD